MKRAVSVVVRSLLPLFLFALSQSCPPAWAQEPIKIGFIYVMSGRLAHYGFGAKQGAELAMDEINRAGGVNGRKLVGVYEDTKLRPEVGVQAARKLVTQDRVDVVMGIVSSGVASAVAPVMNELKMPLIITLAMTPDVTGKICNPYTFRISQNGPQNIKGAAVLASQTDALKWSTLGPDYLFGYQCWEYFQRYLKDLQPAAVFMDESKIAYAPTETEDFRPYIKKVLDAAPDGLLVSLYGGNLVDFVRQGNDLQLFKKIPVVVLNLAYSADVMLGLGIEMPEGLWLGGLYWFRGNATPENQHFVEAYTQRYKVFPDFNASGAYSGVKAYAAAASAARSVDKETIIRTLPGMVLDLPMGKTTIRAEDHQAIFDSVWGVSSRFDGKLRMRELRPLIIYKGEQVTPAPAATGCTMP
jgi:branched-chain amino acid transport system substrate-binding protein